MVLGLGGELDDDLEMVKHEYFQEEVVEWNADEDGDALEDELQDEWWNGPDELSNEWDGLLDEQIMLDDYGLQKLAENLV